MLRSLRTNIRRLASDVVGELFVYGTIGEGWWESDYVTAKDVSDALAEMKRQGATSLRVYVNSLGGSAFDGMAIYSAIRRFEGTKTVCVDGIAASAASLIAMAGDSVEMSRVAMVMIHNPSSFAMGEASELRKEADVLDAVREAAVSAYVAKTKLAAEKVRELLDEETWLTAAQAVELGFADRIVEEPDEAGESEAQQSEDDPRLKKFKHAPPNLRRLLNLSRLESRRTTTSGTSPEPKEPTMLKNLLALLALSETSTEDQALAAVKSMQAREAELRSALGVDSHEKALAGVAGLKAKAESADLATAELAKLQAAQMSAKRLALLDEATRDGRLTPAKRTEFAGENAPAWSRDLSALEGFLSYLPKASAEPKEPAAPAPAALTADDEKVAKQLGLDLAAVAAAKKQ